MPAPAPRLAPVTTAIGLVSDTQFLPWNDRCGDLVGSPSCRRTYAIQTYSASRHRSGFSCESAQQRPRTPDRLGSPGTVRTDRDRLRPDVRCARREELSQLCLQRVLVPDDGHVDRAGCSAGFDDALMLVIPEYIVDIAAVAARASASSSWTATGSPATMRGEGRPPSAAAALSRGAMWDSMALAEAITAPLHRRIARRYEASAATAPTTAAELGGPG